VGDVDKFAAIGLTTRAARFVRPPAIEECLAHLECRVVQHPEAGDHRFIGGEVLAAYARPEMLGDGGLYDLSQAHPLPHLGRDRFTTTVTDCVEPQLAK
jgi:flavin reductase (DIM6/NTAB) family NADH-FMN oxidoreductase RutF